VQIFLLKINDVGLVALFLAIKSQKGKTWLTLDQLLKNWYKQLHPSDSFDEKSDTIQTAISKLLELEKTILTTINYETSFPGVNWIESRMRSVVGQFLSEKGTTDGKKSEEYVGRASEASEAVRTPAGATTWHLELHA